MKQLAWETAKSIKCIVIGADRLGRIPQVLENMSIRMARHISGRVASHQRRDAILPSDIDLIILFTDFLNHNAMRSYRTRAEGQGIRVVACRRSASCLLEVIAHLRNREAVAQERLRSGN